MLKFSDQRVFGELALIYDAKRLSTVKAASGGAVWSLDRTTYQQIITQVNVNKEEDLFNFLRTVDKLNAKAPETLKVVANLLKDAFFEAGSTIIQEGTSNSIPSRCKAFFFNFFRWRRRIVLHYPSRIRHCIEEKGRIRHQAD